MIVCVGGGFGTVLVSHPGDYCHNSDKGGDGGWGRGPGCTGEGSHMTGKLSFRADKNETGQYFFITW